MRKKPNAANITHGFAQLGGGLKKEVGEGMLEGAANIFKTGVQYGAKMALNGGDVDKPIDVKTVLPLPSNVVILYKTQKGSPTQSCLSLLSIYIRAINVATM